MKKHPHNLIEMAAEQESPSLDVRVTTHKKSEVYPALNLLLNDEEAYTSVEVGEYENVYDLVLDWDLFDIVTFTMQWPNGDTISVTRGYLGDQYDRPLVESVILDKDGEKSGKAYVRNDTLATYKAFDTDRRKNLPNVNASHRFIYGLSMNQDLDWETILKSYNEVPNIQDVLLEKSRRSEDAFILSHEVRDEIKFIVENFGIKSHMVDTRTLTRQALQVALKSIVDAIGCQVYGAYFDYAKLHDADVHFNSLGLVAKPNKYGFITEPVYSVIKDDKLHLVFGALDSTDALATFVTDFDLEQSDVDGKLKLINLIYA